MTDDPVRIPAQEQTAFARLPSIATAILDLKPSWEANTAYAYLERVPTTFVEPTDRETGVQLCCFSDKLNFDDWQIGRVFNGQQELRWQWMNGAFHTVWCGSGTGPDGFTSTAHGGVTQRDKPYFLWGRRVRPNDAKRFGIDATTDDAAFMQLQIPRVLRYPLPGKKQYARLLAREFYAANGDLAYARWLGLQEVTFNEARLKADAMDDVETEDTGEEA